MDPTLFGLLISDGSVTLRERNSGKVTFSNKQEILHKKFVEAVTPIASPLRIKTRMNNTGVKESLIESGFFARKILEEINSCRTRACNSSPICPRLKGKQLESSIEGHVIIDNTPFHKIRIPENILSNTDSISEMLRAVASGDGRVKLLPFKSNERVELARKVEIGCKHPQLRKDFIKCFDAIGITAREENDRTVIEGKENLEIFRSKVGFINGCKVIRGFWRDFDKNLILTVLLGTFGLNFTEFKTKEELFNFLVGLVKDKASVTGWGNTELA